MPPHQPRRANTPHDRPRGSGVRPGQKPVLRVFPTTLWEYPSQHYDAFVNDEGEAVRTQIPHASHERSKAYVGATPSWVVWQLLMRYTRAGDKVLDPMCGSGTTLDVCKDLGRVGVGFDLAPSREDITPGDARKLPLPDASIDFAFIDPPYSTHVNYSDDPRCIGKLDAAGDDDGAAYYKAMERVLVELHRVLKDRRCMALYVSDSFKKSRGGQGGAFMPIGPELFVRLCQLFRPLDIVCVTRHNQKLARGNWRKAAEEGNFFLRGFNYLFIMKKEDGGRH